MFVSPQTLREFCLDFLRQQINCEDSLSQVNEAKDQIVINGHLVVDLLQSLSINNELSDEVLMRPIFNNQCTHLRSVRIPDASRLKAKVLRTLKCHPITELVVNGLQNCTINELIGCLGEYSLQRLRLLNVSRSLFTASNKVRHYHQMNV